MIVVLFGANELAMRRRLQEIKDEADGGSGMLVTNFTTLDGRDTKPNDVLAACMAPPFLAPRRLVVVEHLLERFQPRYDARPARAQGAGANAQAASRNARTLGQWELVLEEIAKASPPTTTLVFLGQPFKIEGRDAVVTKTNPFVERLEKLPGVSVEEHPALSGASLTRYIAEEGALRGLRFRRGSANFEKHEVRPPESDPVELLANLLHGDTLSIANELDKLALYTRESGGEVTVADVNRVCHGDRELKAWNLTDAIIDCRLGEALAALQTLKDQGENLQGLLALITTRYRTLAPVVELVAQGMQIDAIAAALNRKPTFPLTKDIDAGKRFGMDGMKLAYRYLVEADRAHKKGEVDEEVALDLLLMKLCALTPPAPVRGGGYRR